LELITPVPKYKVLGGSGSGVGDAIAPMPGVIDKVFVKAGDTVQEGQPMIVMIAMKMEVSQYRRNRIGGNSSKSNDSY